MSSNPVDVRVWCAGEVVIETTLRTSDPITEQVRLPAGNDRFVLETWVNRVMRPRDYGGADPRDLGLVVSWEFVDAPRIGLITGS